MDNHAPGAGAIALRAMALNVPETPDHPNKRPFSGILTRLDEPSDEPPNGTGGRLSVLTRVAAEAALTTLLGMAIDATASLTAHAETRKIGIITTANIVGNEIAIEGFFYAKDFPDEMRTITAQKANLGFSFELTPTSHTITAENHYRVDGCVFTGAALLYRNKAAYHSTSLAAAITDKEPSDMDITELSGKVDTLTTGLATLTDLVTRSIAAGGANLSAASECLAAVEPHAKRLEDAAAKMRGDNIGLHMGEGHSAHLERMAGRMRAEAALGKVPHIYRDHDYSVGASAQAPVATTPTAPTIPTELTKAIETLTASVAEIKTGLADVKAGQRQQSPDPGRKTLPATISGILSRAGIKAEGVEAEGVTSATIGDFLTKAGITDPVQRMTVKRTMERHEQGLAN